MNSFTRSVDLLHRAMDVSTLRYSVSANNLANAEVPNFKRTTVNFEAALKEAIDSEKNAKDYATTSDANGNNVDAEAEAMNILKTQLNYQLLTQMQSFQFSQMYIVLK